MNTLEQLRKYYIPERAKQVDPDFLEFEEEMAQEEDLIQILSECAYRALGNTSDVWNNPYNSIIIYITGLSNEFNFIKGRSETIDGSPPDCI